MPEHSIVCSSCKRRVTNQPGTVKFNCPNCGSSEIIRCRHCREVAAKYACPSCSFTGPN